MDPRITPIAPPYDDEVQALFDRLPTDWSPVFALFTVLAHDPRLLKRFMNGAPAYIPDSNLTVRQREILLLRVTARAHCAYEWGIRVHFFSKEAGLSAEQVAATVESDRHASCWSAEEALLIALADSLEDRCAIEDGLWVRLSAAYEDKAILQMLLLAGYYRTVACLANGLHLPPEPRYGRPFPETRPAGADNGQFVRGLFEETAKGNGKPFIDALADDVRWTIAGTSSWSRVYEGKRAVLGELLMPLRRLFVEPNRVVPRRIVGEGDLVVLEADGNAVTRTGKPYRNQYCWIFRIAGGRIAEITEFANTRLMDEALGPPPLTPT